MIFFELLDFFFNGFEVLSGALSHLRVLNLEREVPLAFPRTVDEVGNPISIPFASPISWENWHVTWRPRTPERGSGAKRMGLVFVHTWNWSRPRKLVRGEESLFPNMFCLRHSCFLLLARGQLKVGASIRPWHGRRWRWHYKGALMRLLHW